MDIGVIILAGGKSSRMGQDKGLISIAGKSIVELVIDVALQISKDIIIISNNQDYSKFGYPLFEDEIENKGPLSGLYTGLNKSKHKLNIVLSCDVPLIDKSIIKKLIDYTADELDAIITKCDEKTHPLIGLYKKPIVNLIKESLSNNELSMQTFLAKLKYDIVEFPKSYKSRFINVNSPEDLNVLKTVLHSVK